MKKPGKKEIIYEIIIEFEPEDYMKCTPKKKKTKKKAVKNNVVKVDFKNRKRVSE